LFWRPQATIPLGRLGIDERIILKWILEIECEDVEQAKWLRMR
jgi:hypothetical protein